MRRGTRRQEPRAIFLRVRKKAWLKIWWRCEEKPRTGTIARRVGVAAARKQKWWRCEENLETGTIARRVGVAAARKQKWWRCEENLETGTIARRVGVAAGCKQKWWAVRGSNSRHPRCKRGALPLS
jgi:hypothetical protein